MGLIDFLRRAAQGHNARPGWENSNPGNFTSAAYARGPRKPVAGLKAGSGGAVMQQDFGGPQTGGAIAQARVDALRAEPDHYGPPNQPAMPVPSEGGSYYGAGGGGAAGAASAGSFYPPEGIQGEDSTDVQQGIIGMMDPEMRDDETGQTYDVPDADWEVGPRGATGSLSQAIRNPEFERDARIRHVLESIKGPQFGRR